MVRFLRNIIVVLAFGMTCLVSVKLEAQEQINQPLIMMSKERLEVQRNYYKRILRNQTWRQRLLYIGTGVAITGASIWFFQWLQETSDQNDKKSNRSTKKNAAKMVKHQTTRAPMSLYEDELERRRYKHTWWGSIDTGVRQGLSFAFASFITGFVLTNMELLTKTFKEKYKDWFQDMDVKEYGLLQSLTKSQCKFFGNSLIESLQKAPMPSDSPEWDEHYVDRVAYISGDVVADHAAWVSTIERLFAFILEALHAEGFEQHKMAAFETSVYQCMKTINLLTEHVQDTMHDTASINKDQASMIMLLLKKICRDVFYIAHTAGTVLYDQQQTA